MVEQQKFYAYIDGSYFGKVVATEAQLAEMGYTSGDAPPIDLDDAKAAALEAAHANALQVRRQIAETTSSERALSWVLKAVFAGIWQANDQAANPHLQPLADIAAAGFSVETGLTGENPSDVRDRSVQKAGQFFMAMQLVEGMERVAEEQISAAETPEALSQAITQLLALEAQALTQLATLSEGGSNDA